MWPVRRFRPSLPLFKGGNHYETLGLKRDATKADIKKSYFELAKKFHPDINPSPQARKKFEVISGAYEVLSDEKLKKKYDAQMDFASGGRVGRNAGGGYRPGHTYKQSQYKDTRTKPKRHDWS
jgi:DnaJ-class molecular chaperone